VATKKKRKKPSTDGILQAAERLFAEQGYGATSLRDLMTAAKVSTTAFYARFDSKEAVLDELMRAFVESLSVAVLEAAARARDVGEGLDSGSDVLVKSIVPHKNLVRLFFSEAPTSPKSKEVVRTLHQQLAAMLGARLHKLRDKGAVHTADPDALGWALLGAMERQLIRWAVLDDLSDRALGGALRASALAVLPSALAPAA
jgi:AcrR family transcriptional regulator